MALSAHLARSSSSPGALPPRPWPNEVALEWRVLQDSRAAACAVADALQAREHEQAALCGSWPLPWAELRAVQGPGGLAAELLEDSTDSVGPGGRDARGNLLPEQLVAACREQLRQSILLWLQSEALEAGGEEESSGEDELQDALEEARDAPANEHLKQQANKGVALMLQMLSQLQHETEQAAQAPLVALMSPPAAHAAGAQGA